MLVEAISQGNVMEGRNTLSQEGVPGTATAAKIMSTASCRLRPAPSICNCYDQQWLLTCLTCGRSKAHDKVRSTTESEVGLVYTVDCSLCYLV